MKASLLQSALTVQRRAGSQAILIVDLDRLGGPLSVDGAVNVLGHVHYLIRALFDRSRSDDADYFYDDHRLEVSVPDERVEDVTALLERLFSARGALRRSRGE